MKEIWAQDESLTLREATSEIEMGSHKSLALGRPPVKAT
jgi:hypothetical protein